MTPGAGRISAADLAALLRPYGLAVEGDVLLVDEDAPADLLAAARLLGSGVRAVVGGRPWYGADADGRGVGPGRDGALDVNALLPAAVARLCCAGDRSWHLVREADRRHLAHLFADPVARGRAPRLPGVTRNAHPTTR